MIAEPFPSVWHSLGDDNSALDYPTIDYINKVLTPLQRKSHLCIPQKRNCAASVQISTFTLSVSDLYIHRIGPHNFLQNKQTDGGNI
jgi:hypothetical protein